MQEVGPTTFLQFVPLSRRGLAELLQCGESTVRAAERGTLTTPPLVEDWMEAVVAFFERNPPPSWRSAHGTSVPTGTAAILREFFETLPLSRHRLASMLKCSEGTLRMVQRGETEVPAAIDAWLHKVVTFLREHPPPAWNSSGRKGRRHDMGSA